MTEGRDRWLAVGLLLLLLVLTIAAAARQSGGDGPPDYSIAASGPEGARALRLWLEGLGYEVEAQVPAAFEVPPGIRVSLLLEPSQVVSSAEWEVLDGWVEGGGTLIVAGSRFASAAAFLHYGYRLAVLGESEAASAQLPLLRSPALTESPQVRPRVYLTSDEGEDLPILAAGSRPLLVRLERGAGQVLLSASAYPFTNAGLKEPGNAALVLSLISTAPAAGPVWFDDWHHGLRAAQASIVGPGSWLRYTPAGRSIAFVAAVLFLALALRGRRFGRPEPLPGLVTRRGPSHYITAIANLGRRARHRQAVLEQYRLALKRSLGRRFHLDPMLPDGDYARLLALMDPRVDPERLGSLLGQLRRTEVSERELVELAAAASRFPGTG